MISEGGRVSVCAPRSHPQPTIQTTFPLQCNLDLKKLWDRYASLGGVRALPGTKEDQPVFAGRLSATRPCCPVLGLGSRPLAEVACICSGAKSLNHSATLSEAVSELSYTGVDRLQRVLMGSWLSKKKRIVSLLINEAACLRQSLCSTR